MSRENTREELADYAHEAWAGWMQYLFSKCQQDQHTPRNLIIPGDLVKRWDRQMKTPYKDLSEKEKDSDRIEAEKMLIIVDKYFSTREIL
jgi:hypothetical protein